MTPKEKLLSRLTRKGIVWEDWWRKNCSLNKSGRRSLNVFLKTADELLKLHEKYNGDMLNDVLVNVCRAEQQCQIPYVKKVLKNRYNAAHPQKERKISHAERSRIEYLEQLKRAESAL